MSISVQLGDTREVRLGDASIRYRERGEGEPIVFVHGVLVNADLWREVVPPLAESYRCIAPDWPLGSHELPMPDDADLSPPGLAALIALFLEELDLRDVTIVGNDTGGGLSQILAAQHPDRIGRLVLTSCDAFRNFPPRSVQPLKPLGYVPSVLSAFGPLLRRRSVQRAALAPLAKKRFPDEIADSFLEPGMSDRRIVRDFGRVFRQLHGRHTTAAAEKLRSFDRPALVAWAAEDRFFPAKHGRRLAELMPDARFELVEDSRTFIPQDQPARLAELIDTFVRETPLRAAA